MFCLMFDLSLLKMTLPFKTVTNNFKRGVCRFKRQVRSKLTCVIDTNDVQEGFISEAIKLSEVHNNAGNAVYCML